MAKALFKNGVTGVITRVFLQDSASATGAGKAGLGIASAGLNISQIADNEATPTTYTSAGSTVETISTLGTFAAPTATKCRFKEVDATNLPGVYEIQIADARWTVSSARSAIVCVQATGVAVRLAEVQLASFDVNDGVRGALTALPNAVAGANGGLPLGDASGRVDLGKWLGTAVTLTSSLPDVNMKTITAGIIAAASFAANALDAVWSTATRVLTAATNLTTALATPTNITAGTITTVTNLTNAPSDSAGVTTLLSRLSALRAGYLDNLSAGAAALESSLQGLITTVGAAGAGLTAAATAVWAVATRVLTAATNLGIPSASDNAAAAASQVTTDHGSGSYIRNTEPDNTSIGVAAAAAASAATNAALLQARVPASPAAVSDIAALFTTAMVESYNADGSAPTPAQALFVIMQRLTEFAIVGTTLTAKKLDGTTTAFTLTFDDATSPTSSTRAT